jgi:phosphohistidine phosphatase SixA
MVVPLTAAWRTNGIADTARTLPQRGRSPMRNALTKQ